MRYLNPSFAILQTKFHGNSNFIISKLLPAKLQFLLKNKNPTKINRKHGRCGTWPVYKMDTFQEHTKPHSYLWWFITEFISKLQQISLISISIFNIFWKTLCVHFLHYNKQRNKLEKCRFYVICKTMQLQLIYICNIF